MVYLVHHKKMAWIRAFSILGPISFFVNVSIMNCGIKQKGGLKRNPRQMNLIQFYNQREKI